MTCEEALLLVSGHLDQENTPEEERQLRRHLEACPECSQSMRALEELDTDVASLSMEPPAGLKDRVMDAVRAEAKPKRKKYRWLSASVAAALVLAVGISQLSQLRAENTAAPAVAAEADAAMPAAYSRTIDDAACDSKSGFFTAPTAELNSQALAEQKRADVAVTRELLPEMEVCACETLEDGTLLYVLENAGAAAELSEKYGLELYSPADSASSEVSYARLVP